MRVAWERATRTKPICMQCDSSKTGLRRCLRLRDVVGFGLGCTVGGGVFVATGVAVSEAGPGVVLSFLLAAIGCACSGLCYAEMSTVAPAAGSSYSFSYNAVGELAAFTVGLVNILGNVLSGAAVARGWASYLELLLIEVGLHPPKGFAMFQLGPFLASPLASLLMVLLGVVNCFGVKTTAKANSVITAMSIGMLGIFVAGALPSIETTRWQPFLPNGIAGVLRGAGTVFFAYLGFDVLACLGEEAEDPTIVARGIIWTIAVSTALYCATAMAFTGLVTIGEVDIKAPLASASRLRGLDALALCISVGAVGNTMTTVVGGILGAPRVCYVMAQDGLLPHVLARVNKHGTPVCALLVTLVPTAVCACLLKFDALAEVVSAGALCSFSLVCFAVVLTRHAHGKRKEHVIRAEVDQVDQGESPKQHRPAPTVVGQKSHAANNATVGNKQIEAGEAAEKGGDADAEFGVTVSSCADEAMVDDKLVLAVGEDTPPVNDATQRLLGICLSAFAFFCLSLGLSLRLPASKLFAGRPLRLILSFLACLGVLLAAVPVILAFRLSGSTKVDSPCAGFRLPFMPLVPLTGIVMNMMLLAELPAEALWRTLIVVAVCLCLYFSYAAPRSHLNDRERVALYSTNPDAQGPP